MNRRHFLKTLATSLAIPSFLETYSLLAAPLRNKVKITDMKVMIVKGATSECPFVKIETDAGITGYGESYWGRGIKEVMLGYLKPMIIGEDPLDIDRLYTKMVVYTGGSGAIGGVTITAISGIEIALWDLAGKILGVPVCKLLGGQYRNKVKVYSTSSPSNLLDMDSCREFAERVKNGRYGFKIVKTDILRDRDPHEPQNRQLSNLEITKNVKGYGNLREALGDGIDIAVHCHWELDWISALSLARAIAFIRPVWLEDPMPPEFAETWVKLTEQSPVPILTGENLYRLQGYMPFIIQQGCHIIQIDIPKAGGLMESKKIAALADAFYMPVCAHIASGPLAFMASAQCCAAMPNFKAHEHSVGNKGDDWEKYIITDGPIIKDGYIQIPDKPGIGVEVNWDYVREHLFPGEVWWG
jgi:L-alanine-DL-glutamate epimerase-like enolase superfamily enzyme